MRYHMVVLSLPRPGFYLCLHKHSSPDLCTWTESDRADFFRVREKIEDLYLRGPISSGFSRPEVELMYDSSISPAQAVSRIMPYYAEATPPNQERVYYVEAKESDLEVTGPAGTEGERFGVRLVTICRGAKELKLTADAAEACGHPDLVTLEGRSLRRLAELAAWYDHPIAEVGEAKVVALPAEPKVRVERGSGGEVVAEIPRIWA